uniref:DWNN domain-containing protein n=1 Tax=Cynoglossus semilaevis TaxID=244447 RepID=A0A3P8WBI3_CYNSE
MSCVHYKFSSQLEYNTVRFSGLHITLCELKKQIMAQERLKATNCDLQITNAQTGEEYTSNDTHIPKHSSVIVRRTPTVEQKRNRTSSNLYVFNFSDLHCHSCLPLCISHKVIN